MEDHQLANISNRNSANIQKLHDIVQKTMEEEQLIVDNLLNPPKETLSAGQQISDKVARFGGSWIFIISFMVLLAIWISYNVFMPKKDTFDPYPFILMNLVLSCVAALQAPIIMMSQNRQEEKDRLRAENDYLVNLKAELEIRSLHQKLDLLLEEQIKELCDAQDEQMDFLKKMEARMNDLNSKIDSYKK